MFNIVPSPYNRHLSPECICRPCAFRQIVQSQGCGACIPQYRWSLEFILFSYRAMPEHLFHHFFPYAGPNRPYVQIDLIAWIRGIMLQSHGMTDIDMVFICPSFGMNHAYVFPVRDSSEINETAIFFCQWFVQDLWPVHVLCSLFVRHNSQSTQPPLSLVRYFLILVSFPAVARTVQVFQT